MLIGGAIAVDHNHLATFRQGRPEPPKKGVGLANFVIHMDQEDAVKTICWQLRIILPPEFDRDIVNAFAFDTLPKPVQSIAVDILCKDAAIFANPPWEK